MVVQFRDLHFADAQRWLQSSCLAWKPVNVTHSGPRNEDVHAWKLNHRHVLRSFNQNRLSGQHPVLAGHPEAGLNHDLGENHNPPVSALLSASGSQPCGFCEPSAIFRFLSQLKVHQILWFCSNSFHSHATYLQCAFCTITQYFASHPRSCKDQEEYWCREKCHKTIIKYLCN